MPNQEAAAKIKKARTGLILSQPFFASLAMRMELTEDNNYPTLATNGKLIKYNADFVNSLSLAELKGSICHEVLHIATMHHTRRSGRDFQTWNEAGDYVINPIVTEAGEQLPAGHLADPEFSGKTTDEVFKTLYGRKQQQDPDGTPEQSNNNNSGQGDQPQDDKQNQPDPNPSEEGETPSQSKSEGQNTPDTGRSGIVEDLEGESDAEKEEEENDLRTALAQAAQQARAAGDLPAGLARLVNEVLAPALDWKELLKQYVDNSAKNDYSRPPFNKRFMSQGIYLPGIKSAALNVAIAVDTSGSIDMDTLTQFAAELNSILETYPEVNATVIYCDTQINGDVEQYTKYDLPIIIETRGGGGTSFRPPFEWINEEADTPPNCLIYLTDLYCYDYPETPEYPVIWAVYGDNNGSAPFGETVKIDS